MHNNWNFQLGAAAGAGGPSRWPEAVPPVFSTVSPDAGIGASSSDRGRQTSHHYKMVFPTWTTTTCYVRILYTYHLEPVSWILLVMTSQNIAEFMQKHKVLQGWFFFTRVVIQNCSFVHFFAQIWTSPFLTIRWLIKYHGSTWLRSHATTMASLLLAWNLSTSPISRTQPETIQKYPKTIQNKFLEIYSDQNMEIYGNLIMHIEWYCHITISNIV